MLFSLDVIRARKGDCLMLHYGPPDEPRVAMIDGGPKAVYGPHLKPRILQLRKARGLADTEPLAVDILMVSHVDDDHIQGILDLTRDLLDAKKEQRAGLVRVRSFWHNSFDDLIEADPAPLTASFRSQAATASVGGAAPPDDLDVEADEEPEVVTSAMKVLASIEQGAQLRKDATGLKFPLNPEFKHPSTKNLIVATDKTKPLKLNDGLTVTVVGPMLPEVEALRKSHQDWLKELKKAGKTPADVLSAYVDKSVPNLSSVVVLAVAGGKRVLLTGDARGDKVLAGLELVGLLKKRGKIDVDIVKVPHHGSSNNLGPDFFERIVASHYVFSGDGEHGNPERETLEMLLAARGPTGYQVHLTYPVAEIDQGRKADWEKEQGKQKKKREKNPKQAVRPNWSPAKHGLVALFKANPAFAKTVRVVEDGKPHVIDLLEQVTF